MLCRRCNQEVRPDEDIAWLESIMADKPALVFIISPCHIRCSPSRAQYIYDDVVDDRPEYDKRLLSAEERETRTKLYTDAFIKLKEEYAQHAAAELAADEAATVLA